MAIHKLKIFSCRGSRYVAEKIAANFGVDLGDSQVLEFSDGEFQPAFDESIRGAPFLSCSRPSRLQTI